MTRRNFTALLACALDLPGQIHSADPPALPGSGMPFLTSGPAGAVYLAWTDPVADKEHALRFSQWTGTSWSTPETIAQGKNWFVNWADFPSLSVRTDGSLLAHWLTRAEGGGTFGYGIRVARRAPGSHQWSEIYGMSLDEKTDYAGFLTFVPDGEAAVYLAPPAHHAPTGGGSAPADEHAHRKTVRVVSFLPDGSPETDLEVDPDVCSCCQTAIGRTRGGLIAAYRDHRPGEIRDISVVRFAKGAWTPPQALHTDGWKINGCPTEGPAISARDRHVAVTWLTRAGDQPRIQLVFSDDEGKTFGKALRVDSGNPLGRPGITRLDSRTDLIVWLEKTTDGVEIRMRRVSLDGKMQKPVVLTSAPAGRASGFPKAAVSGDQILIAWRDERVRAALLTRSQLEEMEQQ